MGNKGSTNKRTAEKGVNIEFDDSCMLRVGSWNVHTWVDGQHFDNKKRVLLALNDNKYKCDMICFQEAQKDGSILKDIPSETNLANYTLPSKVTKIRNFGCMVCTSKIYPIAESYDIAQWAQLVKVDISHLKMKQFPHLYILSVHWDYRDETVRIKQWQTVRNFLTQNEEKEMENRHDDCKIDLNKIDLKNVPIFMIGDFNALTQTDYYSNDWDEIEKVRKDNQWEDPKSDFTDMLKSDEIFEFRDCFEILKRSVESQSQSQDDKETNETKEKKEKKEKEEKEEDKKGKQKQKNKSNKNKQQDDTSGILTNVNLSTMKSFGTSRFDTRIDYILINPIAEKIFHLKVYETFRVHDTSDHKMVRVTFFVNPNGDNLA